MSHNRSQYKYLISFFLKSDFTAISYLLASNFSCILIPSKKIIIVVCWHSFCENLFWRKAYLIQHGNTGIRPCS